jgi:hypothetical protein
MSNLGNFMPFHARSRRKVDADLLDVFDADDFNMEAGRAEQCLVRYWQGNVSG